MTTDKGLLGIRLNAAPLALAILFSVAISASADDDLPTASNSVKVDAKPADADAPRRQDADNPGPEHIDGVAEFIPRPGKCTYKIKRGWTGWLVNGQTFQGISWGIADTQGIGVTSNRTEDKIAMFPGTDPVLDIINIGDYCKFVAVRKGTATIRYLGQGKDGNSRCELQIEVEADTTEIDAALKEAIPQSQIKVTEVRSAALLTGTVPTDLDRLQADNIARQFYPDVITQLKIVTPPVTPPAPEATPQRKPTPKTGDPSPKKTKSGVRAELKQLRSEVQGLRQDIRELNELLAKRTAQEGPSPSELPRSSVGSEKTTVLREGVLSFHAGWCGPCQQMKPIIEKFKKGGHSIQSIDVDAHPELCKEFDVTSIPCFVLLKGGREFDRVTGLMSEADFKKLLGRFEDETPDNPAPLSLNQLPRELSLTVGESTTLTFDEPVTAILPSKADVVVIERGAPKRAHIRAKAAGEITLQLVYRDTTNSERIRLRITDDPLTKALSKTVDLKSDNQPLKSVIQKIGQSIGANIVLDTQGLEAEGVSPSIKQSIVVTEVPARTALRLILKPLHLDFIEENEVIIVTSRVRANGGLYSVTYDVRDHVEDKNGKTKTTGAQLAAVVQQINSNSWEDAGGFGTVKYQQATRSLVVWQTYSVHYQISEFLAGRRRPKIEEKKVIRGQGIERQSSRFVEQRLGVVLAPITREEAAKLPPVPGDDGTPVQWHLGLRVAELKRPHILKADDVIIEMNAAPVTTLDEIAIVLDRLEKASGSTGEQFSLLAPTKPHQYDSPPPPTIKFRVIRDGRLQTLEFELLNPTQPRDAAEFIVRTYSVADLVVPIADAVKPDLRDANPKTMDWFRLIEIIMQDVEPTCWISNGGQCSIKSREKTLSLVIRAPQRIHDEVSTVLSRERRKLDVQVSFTVRMITAPEKPLVDLAKLGLKTDLEAKCSLLNADQSKKILDALQAGGAQVLYAPKITVFNGHTAYLSNKAWAMKDGTVIDVVTQMRGFVAPDRRSVGVNLALNADKVVEELTRRTINVADGSSLLLDVTEELRTKNPDKTISGRAYMLVEPKVIVLEEEEERLEAPKQDRVSMKTPTSRQADPWDKALQNPDPHDWERMPPPEFLDFDTYISDARTGRLLFGVGVNSNSGLVGNIVLSEQIFDIRKPRSSVVEEK